jgi:uncharacterized protein with HEPN domain
LLDILEAIERIERYTGRSEADFKGDELLQTWVVYHLQIIGEAARKLSDDLCEAHPEIPWAQIVAMRNILVHDYFAVDVDEVWAVVNRDLSGLKKKISAVLNSF